MGRTGRHLRAAGADPPLALRPCAGRHPRQRAAHARGGLSHPGLQAGGLRDRRRAGRAGRAAHRRQGRLRQPGDAVLARIGRGAAGHHPRRPGPSARRGAGRAELRAAQGAAVHAGPGRAAGRALAADAGRFDHRLRRAAAQGPDRADAKGAEVSAALLACQGLTRLFGGLTAVSDVSLEFRVGEVHAVIGTNGAGKSTLVNMLSGELPATAGRVQLAGRDVTAWTQPQRARAGIGRSYQRTTIFNEFSVFENARLCAQAAFAKPWHLWSGAAACPDAGAVAREALAAAGLADAAEQPAGRLSHGAKRQLEIAMCLATRPRVLLLDEPLAGMGAEETEGMLALLARLKPGHAIALVEHDMDAVFRIADRITVMVNGQVIASDAPDQIRANREVQIAYLGEGH
ncbi:MAG: ABC transporter ATP-binding protein [Burkholderiales bacterium]|nr:ABC transporter ATP-binding protein [Burkholderiales bacterium]